MQLYQKFLFLLLLTMYPSRLIITSEIEGITLNEEENTEQEFQEEEDNNLESTEETSTQKLNSLTTTKNETPQNAWTQAAAKIFSKFKKIFAPNPAPNIHATPKLPSAMRQQNTFHLTTPKLNLPAKPIIGHFTSNRIQPFPQNTSNPFKTISPITLTPSTPWNTSTTFSTNTLAQRIQHGEKLSAIFNNQVMQKNIQQFSATQKTMLFNTLYNASQQKTQKPTSPNVDPTFQKFIQNQNIQKFIDELVANNLVDENDITYDGSTIIVLSPTMPIQQPQKS